MAGIDPKFYYLTLGLIALCTLVGLVVAYRLQREVNEDLAPPTERDLLGPLEKAYYSGLMREEEFHRIQESMARLKAGEAVPASKPYKPGPKLDPQPGPIAGAASAPESVAGPEPGPEPESVSGPPPVTPPGESGPDHEPG